MPAPEPGESLRVPPASPRDLRRDLALGLAGAVLLYFFASVGHSWLPALVVIGLGTMGALWAAPALSVWAFPLIGATVLLGPLGPGIFVFDPLAVLLAALALAGTAMAGDRAGWDIRTPGLLAIGFLGAPLLVLLAGVPSIVSFLGAYKLLLVMVLLFFAMRRLVPREQSAALLWVFPLVGTIGSLQLSAKTAGLGALLFARLGYRNFYTRLPWGQSDFVSAVMEFCLCICVVLFILDHRPIARAILIGCALLIGQSFLVLFSRAGAVGLALFTCILAVGAGGRRGIVTIATAGAVGLIGLATAGGQVFVHRFTEPSEYQSWYARIVYLQNGWTRFLSHPVVGIGLNQGRYQHDTQGGESTTNLFVDVMSEQGILGGIMLLLILIGAFRLSLRVEPGGYKGNPRLLQIAVTAAIAEMVLHSMVEPVISGPPIAILFVFLLSWLCLNDPRRVPA